MGTLGSVASLLAATPYQENPDGNHKLWNIGLTTQDAYAAGIKKLARYFNFTFRYIDDVLSLNNSMFGDFVDRIYPRDNIF
jgi:hypothetical protein